MVYFKRESFNYDLFIRPVFVLGFFFFCLSHRQHGTNACCARTHALRVLIARLSRRKPRRRRGRPQKQRNKYSNEHPITPAKSHFCAAHTGAKLRSFDLKPLLTRSRRRVISDRRLRQCLERLLFLSLFLALAISLSLGPSLNTLPSLRQRIGGGQKRGRLQITDNDGGLMKRTKKFH